MTADANRFVNEDIVQEFHFGPAGGQDLIYSCVDNIQIKRISPRQSGISQPISP
jgi:hypothetical protein